MGRKLTLEKKVEMIEYGYKPRSITWLIKKYKIHGIDGLKKILSKYLEGESIEKYI